MSHKTNVTGDRASATQMVLLGGRHRRLGFTADSDLDAHVTWFWFNTIAPNSKRAIA
jgi:hypothetical protein